MITSPENRLLARSIFTLSLNDILEKTKVVVNLNETLKSSNSQCRKVNICLSRKLARQASVARLCSELCQTAGLDRPGLDLTPSTTHLVVAEAEAVTPHTFNYLAALAVGASIVR